MREGIRLGGIGEKYKESLIFASREPKMPPIISTGLPIGIILVDLLKV